MSGNTMNSTNTNKVNLMRNFLFFLILSFFSFSPVPADARDFNNSNAHLEFTEIMIKIAEREYEEVAKQVEDFYAKQRAEQEANKPKAYAKLNIELFVQEMNDFIEAKCSAWKWQGKVWAVKHCVTHTEEQQAADPVAELKKAKLEVDLYDEGIECSPDIRWWGGTTNRWVTIPAEQIFRFTRDDDVPVMRKFAIIGAMTKATSALDLYNWALQDKKPTEEKKEAAKKAFVQYYKYVNYVKTTYITQEYLCSSSVPEDSVKGGDSGGPLMLGDEPIGSVSYHANSWHPDFDDRYGSSAISNYPVSCFATIDSHTNKLGYVAEMEADYSKQFDKYSNVFGALEVIRWTHE